MCSLTSDPPCWVAPPREETNDAYDFLVTLMWLIQAGALRHGDILILDNASVHRAAAIVEEVEMLLEISGVRMFFLPAYSPELNPCELVFAWVKRQLRCFRNELPLWRQVQDLFASMTGRNMEKFYKHCIVSVLH